MKYFGFGVSIQEMYRNALANVPASSKFCEIIRWNEEFQVYDLSEFDEKKTKNKLNIKEIRMIVDEIHSICKFRSSKSYKVIKSEENLFYFLISFKKISKKYFLIFNQGIIDLLCLVIFFTLFTFSGYITQRLKFEYSNGSIVESKIIPSNKKSSNTDHSCRSYNIFPISGHKPEKI